MMNVVVLDFWYSKHLTIKFYIFFGTPVSKYLFGVHHYQVCYISSFVYYVFLKHCMKIFLNINPPFIIVLFSIIKNHLLLLLNIKRVKYHFNFFTFNFISCQIILIFLNVLFEVTMQNDNLVVTYFEQMMRWCNIIQSMPHVNNND